MMCFTCDTGPTLLKQILLKRWALLIDLWGSLQRNYILVVIIYWVQFQTDEQIYKPPFILCSINYLVEPNLLKQFDPLFLPAGTDNPRPKSKGLCRYWAAQRLTKLSTFPFQLDMLRCQWLHICCKETTYLLVV